MDTFAKFKAWAEGMDPNTGMDPDTGQIHDQKKYDAWRIQQKQAAATKAASAGSSAPRHGLGPQGDDMKQNHALADAVFAVKDFITNAANSPANDKHPPEKFTTHGKFKQLLDAIPGYSDKAKAELTRKMVELIGEIRRKRQTTSGPTATPAAAAPPAAKSGGFGSWLKSKVGLG